MKINGHLQQNPQEMCHTSCSSNVAGNHLQEKNLQEGYLSISYMRSTKDTKLNSFKNYIQIKVKSRQATASAMLLETSKKRMPKSQARPGTHHTMPNRPLDWNTEVVMADSSHLSRKGALMMGNFHKHWHSKGWNMGSFPCCKKETVTLFLLLQ